MGQDNTTCKFSEQIPSSSYEKTAKVQTAKVQAYKVQTSKVQTSKLQKNTFFSFLRTNIYGTNI